MSEETFSEYKEKCGKCGHGKYLGVPCHNCETLRKSGKNPSVSDGLLAVVANLFLWPGLVAGLIMIVMALDSYPTNTIGVWTGAFVMIQAIFVYAVLKGIADIIRLLKVIAGVESPTTTVKTEKSASQIDAQAK